MKKWWEQKTTWTAITGTVGAIAGMVTGSIDIPTGFQTVIGCLAFVFLRQGVEKSK